MIKRYNGYSGGNTRRFRKTIARVRDEQMGVQLRSGPEADVVVSMRAEHNVRACGACGLHACACVVTIAVPKPSGFDAYDAWKGMADDAMRKAFTPDLNAECACGSVYGNHYAQSLRCPGRNSVWRSAVPEPKPAEREVRVVMVGDVWAGSVGNQYRITRVGSGGTPPHRAIVVQKGGSYTEAMLEGRAAP